MQSFESKLFWEAIIIRILYLHQYFNTPKMPGPSRSYQIARRLVSYGHQVTMVTTLRQEGGHEQRTWFQTEEDGILVHWLPLPYSNKLSYYERIKVFFKFAWRASIKAAAIDCDLVYATSTPLTIALPAVYAKKRLKVPMVFEVRDLWPELPIAVGAIKNPLIKAAAKQLERFAYRNAEQIVALSPGMKEGIVNTGYAADNVTVIPNSCDIEFFDKGLEQGEKLRSSYEWLQDRPLVIYTGTIGIINGVDYLARLSGAVRDLDSEIRFLVIGSGHGENNLREVAEKYAVLNKNFFIFPRVPKYDIPGWLSAADMATSLFVDLKEMWSNSANKFFDALAAGKPVAINYGGWQAGILEATGAGLVLDPKDIEASAELLTGRIRDIKWLESARIAAKNLARDSFDRNKLAKTLESVLLEAVEGK